MSQILQENICARASFLIKLQAWNKQGELELNGGLKWLKWRKFIRTRMYTDNTLMPGGDKSSYILIQTNSF